MESSHAPNYNDNDKRQRETRRRSTRLQTQHLFSDRHIASHLLRVTTISHPHAVSESGCAGLVLSFPKVQDVGNKKQTVFFCGAKPNYASPRAHTLHKCSAGGWERTTKFEDSECCLIQKLKTIFRNLSQVNGFSI